ncbi:hypothetical protein CAPTEDRAFT_190039 [Capitella teleta]|uniref:THAP-type domain-containing protein n=1 Tax=Capitella teleta TaxID=283909 RepID=R7THW1_CAPTE|nr:hypothetical protein CAPTEDRAFT_190039 [Capitella teleta]|eukprot:ELT93294.1 hypothetical protein CAPTEDRAFT_190039 [Capitella teleta]
MPVCCVIGCKNTWNLGKEIKLYNLPKGKHAFHRNCRSLWLSAIGRTEWPEERQKNAVICSAHFISGRPSMDYTHPDFTPSVFAEDKENPLPRKEKSRSVKRKALHNSNSSNFPNERPAVHSKDKDLEVSTVPKDQFDDLNTQYTRLHADWLNLRDEVTQLKLENQQLREKQESFSFKSVAASVNET